MSAPRRAGAKRNRRLVEAKQLPIWEIRTSMTHPIRVDWVPVPVATSGALGATICPGERHRQEGRTWIRDLDLDLLRVRDDYRADVLVCLVEKAEMGWLLVPGLLERAQHLGLTTRWFPIQDGSTPLAPALVVPLVKQILGDLGANRRVVVHCRGGQGRSGTLISCCLVALGAPATEAIAIAIARHARKGALENEHQVRFVGMFAAEANRS